MSISSPPVAQAHALRTWRDWAGFALNLHLLALALVGIDTVGVAAITPVLFDALLAFTFLVRGRPRRVLPGLAPRLAAYGATYGVLLFLAVGSRYAPHALAPATIRYASIGTTIWLLGTALSVWPIWQLRHSFGIAPVARELVQSGPYRIARHPIYSAYLLVHLGLLLQRPSVALACALAAWVCVLAVRVGYEEEVLGAAFPEYAAYRERVGAFGPKRWAALVGR